MAKAITAFQCDFCGRLFLSEKGAKQHERSCHKNPCVARACYTCVHFVSARDEYVDGTLKEGERIHEVCIERQYNDFVMKVDRNKCKAHGSLLYNPYRFPVEISECLENETEQSWEAMPSAEAGCPNYEPQIYYKEPRYPVSHKIESENDTQDLD